MPKKIAIFVLNCGLLPLINVLFTEKYNVMQFLMQ